MGGCLFPCSSSEGTWINSDLNTDLRAGLPDKRQEAQLNMNFREATSDFSI